MSVELRVIGLEGIGEVRAGDDLAALLLRAADDAGAGLQTGDVLVVTQKIVSKAEGRVVDLTTVTPSPFAEEFAAAWQKDARMVEVVLRESRRVVRMDRGIMITETKHGFVCANAGVDHSNVPGGTMVTLLPVDPDASAERIRAALAERTGAALAVIISDTFGRPWREGTTDIAIGVAGFDPLLSHVGVEDPYGYRLNVSVSAVADELTGAAELVMGKISGIPAALIRGYPVVPALGSARSLVRGAATDLFR
jgi:coenzyme F420-0:L-glutamate ligase/coenzyme F420-1:gamma-L-glutamate ligase